MTQLIHFSSNYLTHVDSMDQIDKPHSKPTGLWISVEGRGSDGWGRWCRNNNFRRGTLKTRTEIKLKPDANILWLKGPVDILDFTADYQRLPDHYPPSLHDMTMHIDWKKVAEKYQGIIIAPYDWHLRLDSRTEWYYSWDCASGCIWDAEAVEILIPIPVRQRKVTA